MANPPTLVETVCGLLREVAPSGKRPLLIGLSGPQGCGKSTVTRAVVQSLDLSVIPLSLDDFYLTRPERQQLAEAVSPLFETRGPPGTHDVELLMQTIAALREATDDSVVTIPKFDKSIDDRLDASGWSRATGRPDMILLEGWLIGARLADDFAGGPALNDIEAKDVDGAWRSYQANQLNGPYRGLWDEIDYFIHIDGPEFDTVHQWRLQQEVNNLDLGDGKLPLERKEWVCRFIEHFERITKDMADGHRQDGAIITIDATRDVVKVSR